MDIMQFLNWKLIGDLLFIYSGLNIRIFLCFLVERKGYSD